MSCTAIPHVVIDWNGDLLQERIHAVYRMVLDSFRTYLLRRKMLK